MSRPLPIPGPDRQQIEALNQRYRIDAEDEAPRGLRDHALRLLRKVGLLFLGPHLRRQQHFNALVVDHLNRADQRAQQAHARSEEALIWTEGNLYALAQRFDEVELSGDDLRRHREAADARERRAGAAVERLTAAHEELRAALGLLQVATQSLRGDMARLTVPSAATSPAVGSPAGAAAPAASTTPAPPAATVAATPGAGVSRDGGYKYVGFEERFRGSQDDIRQRQLDYVTLFTGASDVLDVGCGRGEFLTLLGEHGVSARGLDINQTMVDVCTAKGLSATAGDAVAYLHGLPDASLGGLIAAQVVEHFDPPYLNAFVEVAFAKLRPGAVIVLETINAASWYAFFSSYIRDYTHRQPLHPETLGFLLEAAGFQRVELRYLSPVADAQKLQRLTTAAGTPLADVAEALNANLDRLNGLLFAPQDYAAIGRRP
ncbi:MAG: class I SAM-dependent methyltransferase [Vicinamibacterales bacterium]